MMQAQGKTPLRTEMLRHMQVCIQWGMGTLKIVPGQIRSPVLSKWCTGVWGLSEASCLWLGAQTSSGDSRTGVKQERMGGGAQSHRKHCQTSIPGTASLAHSITQPKLKT